MIKQQNFQFSLEKAYLEMARASFSIKCIREDGKGLPEGFFMTNNTLFALTAQTYIFSYMALVAFVNLQLGMLWKISDSPLRKKYQKAKDLNDLLKHTKLRELKEAIKELCTQYEITHINKNNSALWNDLNQFVKETRDFMVHPKPDKIMFQKIMERTLNKLNVDFPVNVVQNIISYFYYSRRLIIPKWVKTNQEFKYPEILALSTKKHESKS